MGPPRPQHTRTPLVASSSSRPHSTRTSRTRSTYPHTRGGCRRRQARRRAASAWPRDRRRHTPTHPRRRPAQAPHPRRRAVSVATTVPPSARALPRHHRLPASPHHSRVDQSSRRHCCHRRRRRQTTSSPSRNAGRISVVGTKRSVRRSRLCVRRSGRRRKPSATRRAGSAVL